MGCQTPTASGRLNAFQKVMLQWSSLHPYNAVHTYKIAGPLRLGDLAEAVETAFRCHGLGIARLSADGESFRHETDTQPEVEAVVGGEHPEDDLKEYVSRALNRPFERPVSRPFRLAALDAGPHAHYVILAYDHWVADSYAARLVLRSILGRYLALPAPRRKTVWNCTRERIERSSDGVCTAGNWRGRHSGPCDNGIEIVPPGEWRAGRTRNGRSITVCTIPFRAR